MDVLMIKLMCQTGLKRSKKHASPLFVVKKSCRSTSFPTTKVNSMGTLKIFKAFRLVLYSAFKAALHSEVNGTLMAYTE